MFSFRHYSGHSGDVCVNDKRAAEILSVTLKTIKKYAAEPEKADRAKMAYLEAVACRRILPSDWQVWVDGDTFHTGTGYSFNKCELESIGWLRETFRTNNEQVGILTKQVKELEQRIKELEELREKEPEPALPSNVVMFKPR